MTYNATSLNLIMAVRNGKLVERKPLRPDSPHVRRLFVTPEIAHLLDGKRPNSGFPHYAADADIARYMASHLVFVSLTGNSKPKPDLERLRDLDEVWAFCLRKLPPGWRIFGRFWEKNVFIGLSAYNRHDLGSAKRYGLKASPIPRDWEAIIGDAPPHRGNAVGDYVTEVYRDVDQEA